VAACSSRNAVPRSPPLEWPASTSRLSAVGLGSGGVVGSDAQTALGPTLFGF
jgi:hypothetical protein